MRIGSLFSGYGGLDMGVQAVLDGKVAWHVEVDPSPAAILAHHFPDVPNHGDITAVDWSSVEPVDILTGGFPCQDVSLAGARRGLRAGTRSGLWAYFAEAIDALRPSLVVIENVRGLLSAEAHSDMEPCPWCLGDAGCQSPLRALGAVHGDLADLGYHARWCGVSASEAGAPHIRYRVFIVAYPSGLGHGNAGATSLRGLATPALTGDIYPAQDADRAARAPAPDAGSVRGSEGDHEAGRGAEGADGSGVADERGARPGDSQWGIYEPAIRRWERVTGRQAPAATTPDGRDGAHRLSGRFTEWMMGIPDGWVTDPAIGLGRNAQLKALGNGVVPQQAALALRRLVPEPAGSPVTHDSEEADRG